MKKPPMIVRVMNSILIFGFALLLTMGAIYLWITEPGYPVAGRCISLFFLLLSLSLTTLGISIAKGEVR